MGDSDEELDKRNSREKFRPERNDYERRSDDRRGREPWEDRGRDRRGGYREFDRGRHDRFSPIRHEGSPPQMKRMRRDWDDGGFPHYDVPYGLPPPPVAGTLPPPAWVSGSGDSTNKGATAETENPTQPAMMTFKQFLSSQDDNITDEEAIKKFGDYKVEFRKQQINEFFVQHKDEEWFRLKYHPEEYNKRQEESKAAVQKRCEVFSRLLELNRVASVSLDVTRTDDIVSLLDAAVILLEGGTEFDLKTLEQTAAEGQQMKSAAVSRNPVRISFDKTEAHDQSVNSFDKADKSSPSAMGLVTKTKKRPREKSGSGSESETGSVSDTDDEDTTTVHKNGEVATKDDCNDDADDSSKKLSFVKADTEKDVNTQEGATDGEERVEPQPRALHKTQSVFLRNLPALITRQEIEEVCRHYPGFLRVFLQDPQPDRRFMRRGWLTFDHTVNIKEICWNLNNIRLRDCDIGAIVNRELKQRVRSVSGLTVHRPVTKQDVKLAAKLIQMLDNRWKLWHDETEEKKDKEKASFGFVSQNPVLKNITEYLVDEGSYEEEALLGKKLDEDKQDTIPEVFIDQDEVLIKVVDKMLLYLRIVHSFDYYSAMEYPNEDEMPHRCGIIHCRGAVPTGQVAQAEVDEWLSSFEQRILPFMSTKIVLDDVEIVRLGKKVPNEEVEKFITANAQELAKDKWLCPLSGKKFKGPEFVRKHILAKHMEKVEEVKQEVEYFNNYLRDPRRPQLPEHPSSKPSTGSQPAPAREPYMPPTSFHGPLPPPPPVSYRPAPYAGRRAGGPAQFRDRSGPDHFRGGDFRRDRFPPRRDGRARADPRGVVSYNDLDAPPDVD